MHLAQVQEKFRFESGNFTGSFMVFLLHLLIGIPAASIDYVLLFKWIEGDKF